MSSAGTAVSKKKQQSKATQENAERISSALREASLALTQAGYKSDLEISRSYQLANRLAFAWRLASGGIPVVLVYLGFTGDTGIADAGEPLRNGEHWDTLFSNHLAEIAPGIRGNSKVEVGAGFWVLSRSRRVASPSPARPSPPQQ